MLGEFQDACVAGGLLRRYAEGLPVHSGNHGQINALGSADRRAGPPGCDAPGRLRSTHGSGSIPRVVERDSSPAWPESTHIGSGGG